MENELIEQIRSKLGEIKKISSEDQHFNLDWPVSAILVHLIELKRISENADDQKKYEFIWSALDHTYNKEVRIAREDFLKARKKNASFPREKEYRTSLRNAIDQVISELSYFRQLS